ncbi:hypothetical protein HYV56_00665 [Candidatus Peregrinibacteria bacterium]|nr:hypothetical protein [Candidatus Peregrinibacteria bacterium]
MKSDLVDHLFEILKHRAIFKDPDKQRVAKMVIENVPQSTIRQLSDFYLETSFEKLQH